MSCKLPYKTAEANAKDYLKRNNVIDPYLNITDLKKFREVNKLLTQNGIERYDIEGKWFYEENNGTKAVPNKELFKKVDNKNNIFYSLSPSFDKEIPPFNPIKKSMDTKEETVDKTESKLLDIITNFLNNNDISVEVVDNLTTRKNLKADALADILNKVIKISKDKLDSTVLGEEAAHFLVEMLKVKNPTLYNRLYELSKNTTEYNNVLETYSNEYDNNEELLVKETMGKLINNYIHNNKNKSDTKTDNIIQRILKYIKSIFKNSNEELFEKQLNEVLKESSSYLLEGTSFDIRNFLSTDTLYSISGKKTGVKAIDDEIRRQQKVIDVLKSQRVKGNETKNNKINARITAIENYIKKLVKTRDIGLIEDLAKSQVDKVEQLFNNFTSLSREEKEDLYAIANDYLSAWRNLSKIIQYEDEELNKNLSLISDKASRLLDNVNKLYINNYLNDIFISNPHDPRNLFINPTETNFFEAQFLDISVSKIPLFRKIYELLDRASFSAYESAKEFEEETSKEVKLLKEWAKANNIKDEKLWDLFVQKDNKGNLTGNYITNIKQEFYDIRSKLLKEAKETKKWNKYYKFLEENTDIIVDNDKYNKAKSEAKLLYTDVDGNVNEALFTEWIKEHNPTNGKKKYLYIEYKPKESLWKDDRYTKIENTPELQRFYNYFVTKLDERKGVLPVNMQSNFIPELKRSMLHELSKKKMTDIFRGLGPAFVKYFSEPLDAVKDYSLQDPLTGRPQKKIPVYMVSGKLNADEKSYDLEKVLNAFAVMSYSYEYKAAVEDPIIIARNIFKTLKERIEVEGKNKTNKYGEMIELLNGNKQSIDQLEYYIDSMLYDKHREDHTSKIGTVEVEGEVRKITIGNIIDRFIDYTRLKGLSFNAFSAVTNTLFGTISNFIHAAGNVDYTESQLRRAVLLATSIVKPNSKVYNLAKEFNLVKDATDTFYESGSIGKKMGDVLFFAQIHTEKFVQSQTMIATMLNIKLKDKNGKEHTLFDAFDDNGKFKKDEFPDYNYGDGSQNKFELYKKIQQINKYVHGNYDPDSPIKIKSQTWGRMIMIFRRWLPQAISARIGKEYYDERLGRTMKGRWISAMDTYKNTDLVNYVKMLGTEILSQLSFRLYKSNSFEGLSEIDQENMRKNVAELRLILTLIAASSILKSIELDDDDEKVALLTFITNQSMRIEGELSFFVSPVSQIKILRDISPVTKSIVDVYELIPAAIRAIQGEDKIKTGYNKDKSNFVRKVKKVIPVVNHIQRLEELENLNLDSRYTR